jgi:hypothetical protein
MTDTGQSIRVRHYDPRAIGSGITVSLRERATTWLADLSERQRDVLASLMEARAHEVLGDYIQEIGGDRRYRRVLSLYSVPKG